MLECDPMRVNTKTVIDIASGAILESEGFDYDGPVALCDRGAAAGAATATQGLLGAGQTYTGQAGGLSGYLTPMLEGWASGNAPGYGSDLGYMQGAAQSTAQAGANQARQGALLNAMRTRNAAGLGLQNVAAASNAGQQQTEAVQNILSQNAQLKAQQQMGAMNMLGSMYGTDVSAGLQGYSAGSQSALNQAKAGQTGWFQNMLGLMGGGAAGAGGAANLINAIKA